MDRRGEARRKLTPADTSTDAEAVHRVVAATWRIEAAKIIAVLARYVGDVSLAEDLTQEALAEALLRWPESGIPANPAAWLTTVAKRRAIDSWRRQERFDERLAALAGEIGPEPDELPWDPDAIDDDVLRLVFIACHPMLGRAAQLALTLRVVGGLSAEEIARAFLIPVSTVQQRIVRAKRTLSEAGLGFELPPANERPQRLKGVLGVLYLMFSEGHVATTGADWMRPELAMEALRITRVCASLMPREPEVHGLVALMAFTSARFPSRLGPGGKPILLADQDRSLWDRSLIRLGHSSLRTALDLGLNRGLGPYCLQAMVAECHADAQSTQTTDWSRIADLYEQLDSALPSPITRLNRAIAVAEADGPEPGLDLVDEIAATGALASTHHLPSVRGELLMRLDRWQEAVTAFEAAALKASNDREREVLLDKSRAAEKAPSARSSEPDKE